MATPTHSAARGFRAALAAALLAGAAGAAPAPRLACDEPIVKFGKRGTDLGEVSHTFKLKNTGDVTLEITHVEQHCGCTEMKLSHRLVPPGAAAELKVTFSLRGRSGDVEKYLLVHSSDPAQPVFRLGFEGEIEPEVDLRPIGVLYGAISATEAVTQSVEVVFAPEKPDRVREVKSDCPQLAAAVTELEPGRRYRVDVRTVPPLDPALAFLRANLRVTTDRRRLPPVTIPVAATLLSDLVVGPERIILFASEQGPLTRFAAVQPGRIREFRILGVEAPDPAIRAQVEPVAGRGYRIRLQHIPAARALDGKKLVIRTDARGYERIEIPFAVLEDAPR